MIKIKKFPIQKFLTFAALTVSTAFSVNAYAEMDLSGLYSGFIFSNSQFESKTPGFSKTTQDWGHGKVKIGKILNEYTSVEGQFGMTTNSDADHGNLTYGIYLRAGKDFDQYKLYGLAGLGGFHSYADGLDNVSENGFSYGVGIEIFGSKDLTVTLEYVSLVDKSVDGADIVFDTLGLGFTYYFTEDTSYFNKNRNKIRSIRY